VDRGNALAQSSPRAAADAIENAVQAGAPKKFAVVLDAQCDFIVADDDRLTAVIARAPTRHGRIFQLNPRRFFTRRAMVLGFYRGDG
jgi:hypothetical protein